MLPTLVAPRYIPGTPGGDRTADGWASPTDAVPDADRITPKIGDVQYGLRLDLTIDLGVEVLVESPSHAIVTDKRDGRIRVSFAQKEVALDRDVVVVARGVKGVLAGVIAQREGEGNGFFELTVVPDLFEPGVRPPPQDVVFLVDTSGSMAGESLPQAQAALKLCLRHLREGDHFNIIQFNSTFTSHAPAPVTFTQQALNNADRWIEGLRADGGTELLQPMLAAVHMAPSGVVVLLTDGQVGNEAEILIQVLRARKSTRILSFGIGTNVSDELLRDLGRRTDGGVEFIHPGERIEEKVTAQFATATAPRVTNLELKWSGVEPMEVSPSAPPPLVDGIPWTIFGRYAAESSGHVEIFGRRGEQPFQLTVPVTFPARESHPALRPLWASERIAEWQYAALQGRRAEALKEHIIKTAIEYGVSSQHTSFVVVEKRSGDRLAHGQPEARFVPVARPAGWDMFGGASGSRPRGAAGAVMARAAGAAGSPPLAAPAPMAAMSPMPAPSASRVFSPRENTASAGGAPAGGFISSILKKILPPPQQGPSAPVRDDFSASASDDSDGALAEEVQESVETALPDDLMTLFAQQLLVGLWEEPGANRGGQSAEVIEERQVRRTVAVLQRLVHEGIDTSHAVFGVQVRKAIEALLQAIPGLASRGLVSLVEEALGVAWLVASGPRTRSSVLAVAQGFPAMKGRLADEPALRASVLGKQALAP
jgi:Ca-activated chloride channel family protein